MKLTEVQEERFWSRIVDYEDPVECWEWDGAYSNGSPRFQASGQHQATHVAWFLHYGHDVREGLVMLQVCGNDECVNPRHLREATLSQAKAWHRSERRQGLK